MWAAHHIYCGLRIDTLLFDLVELKFKVRILSLSKHFDKFYEFENPTNFSWNMHFKFFTQPIFKKKSSNQGVSYVETLDQKTKTYLMFANELQIHLAKFSS